MTPYTYEAPDGSRSVVEFPMGTAPRTIGQLTRVYDGAIQFAMGREDFHGPTLTERIRQQEAECAADGVKMEPVGSRWV